MRRIAGMCNDRAHSGHDGGSEGVVATYGPEQRALLESAGVELFERVLA